MSTELAVTDAAVIEPVSEPRSPALPSIVPQTPQQCRVMEVNEALAPAYAKASTLELTDDEVKALMAPFPDSSVDIRPHDGLIYISHIHISNRLNQVFKPGKWALMCRRHWLEGTTMYGEYVLLIRGCYVGESVGGHPYQPNNPKTNYSDTLESTAAEALRRIAGKRLSCGSQVWESDYAKNWVAKYAVQANGKWTKRIANVAPIAANVAPPVAKVAPKVANVETPEGRKARFIKLCIEAGGGKADYANELFREMGTLMPNEELNDLPVEKVPTTKKTAENILDEIKTRAGIAEPELQQDAPPEVDAPPADAPETFAGEKLQGYIATVKETPTKNGGRRYGICITPERDQREGGEWINTFDDHDGETAMELKGHEISCYFTVGKYGKDLTKHSIVEII